MQRLIFSASYHGKSTRYIFSQAYSRRSFLEKLPFLAISSFSTDANGNNDHNNSSNDKSGNVKTNNHNSRGDQNNKNRNNSGRNNNNRSNNDRNNNNRSNNDRNSNNKSNNDKNNNSNDRSNSNRGNNDRNNNRSNNDRNHGNPKHNNNKTNQSIDSPQTQQPQTEVANSAPTVIPDDFYDDSKENEKQFLDLLESVHIRGIESLTSVKESATWEDIYKAHTDPKLQLEYENIKLEIDSELREEYLQASRQSATSRTVTKEVTNFSMSNEARRVDKRALYLKQRNEENLPYEKYLEKAQDLYFKQSLADPLQGYEFDSKGVLAPAKRTNVKTFKNVLDSSDYDIASKNAENIFDGEGDISIGLTPEDFKDYTELTVKRIARRGAADKLNEVVNEKELEEELEKYDWEKLAAKDPLDEMKVRGQREIFRNLDENNIDDSEVVNIDDDDDDDEEEEDDDDDDDDDEDDDEEEKEDETTQKLRAYLSDTDPDKFPFEKQGLRACPGHLQRKGKHGTLKCHKLDITKLNHMNTLELRRFLKSDAEILHRRKTGLCAKCQRKVSQTVKRARSLGFLNPIGNIKIEDVIIDQSSKDFHQSLDPRLPVMKSKTIF